MKVIIYGGVIAKNISCSIIDDIYRLFVSSVSAVDNSLLFFLLFTSRSVFDDALPMVGTGASVGVMRNLMVQQQVNDIIINTWLSSLAFIPRWVPPSLPPHNYLRSKLEYCSVIWSPTKKIKPTTSKGYKKTLRAK